MSDEHIVAEGLGGKLVLPESSCEECAKITCDTEGAILQTLFLAPRRHLKIKGKKRKHKVNSYPLTTVINGEDVKIYTPIEEHPSVLLMLMLDRPRLLNGAGGIAGIWTYTLGDVEPALSRGVNNIASPAFDILRFCQMLAKIAHSYASAQFGLLGFRPLLTEFITKKFKGPAMIPECYNFIGGYNDNFAPSKALHTLGHNIVCVGNNRYFVVYIRLFSNLGAPVYSLVVGEKYK